MTDTTTTDTESTDVAAARARVRAWRPFAQHTPAEVDAHRADRAVVDAADAAAQQYDLPGADPMGDQ